MTKVDARKILGISRSAGLKTAERAYRQKQQAIQVRMLPGNPYIERQQAHMELTELTEAWRAMQTKRPKRGRPVTQHKTATPQTRKMNVEDVIQDFFEAWDLLVELMPFSKFKTRVILICFFVVIVLLLC